MSNTLLRQALAALEHHTQQTRPIQRTEAAILGLRAHLAQPEAEPEYWQWRRKDERWGIDQIYRHEVYATTDDSEVRKLYTHPAQPAPVLRDALQSVQSAMLAAWADGSLTSPPWTPELAAKVDAALEGVEL